MLVKSSTFLPTSTRKRPKDYFYRNIVSGRMTETIHFSGTDKSLYRPTSRCILFDGENISFYCRFVIHTYIYIYRIKVCKIMIINWMYETQNLLSL